MATPEFILELRRHIGTAPLWLTGVTAVVLRERAGDGGDAVGSDGGPRAAGLEVLLVRRSDTGAWTPVTGIVDPGEEPAVAAAREVLEEADVVATAQRLASVSVTAPVVYGNGDRTQYIDLTFRFGYVSGDPHPADGENTDAAWFDVAVLPPMSDGMRARIDDALPERGEALFAV
ncbi:ADP-ribose pyrophosphatase [Serinibacter arcticus]|uniref:ADP-ribose pyrophosphatase n=1 Tax=Serinibacter arcticus TaxID=1655435 RepID=A0A2U1ZWS1_9MICO|nr:NUDIX domain-containing protein [Serinibacter arcticus]PWD51428.1 ADP-ribose pyrophosphatase [Serinibacter arcticus]